MLGFMFNTDEDPTVMGATRVARADGVDHARGEWSGVVWDVLVIRVHYHTSHTYSEEN